MHLTFWARGPGIQAGRALDTPTQHTDFAITFVEIAQAKIPSVRCREDYSPLWLCPADCECQVFPSSFLIRVVVCAGV